jgi:colanic acid biosynthesis protein WcaH
LSGPGETERRQALDTLSAWANDPRRGLPEELFLFVSGLVPIINVDLLIRDDAERILLTWRDDRHYGAGWHVPGGIIRFGEPAEDRLRITAARELGAEIDFDPAPLAVEQFLHPEWKQRGHFVTLLYRCRL